ncbi:unnamed protein product [Trifolium pratense]|uniref:Uncharacterized protein n=1 Tax=Trifolium pratense TaxID=57577 RepID=A0ACB0LTV0_TRIPR|nr:unnamed protein product [Trifolium pratense]
MALQQFVHLNLGKSKAANLVYNVMRHRGEGLGYEYGRTYSKLKTYPKKVGKSWVYYVVPQSEEGKKFGTLEDEDNNLRDLGNDNSEEPSSSGSGKKSSEDKSYSELDSVSSDVLKVSKSEASTSGTRGTPVHEKSQPKGSEGFKRKSNLKPQRQHRTKPITQRSIMNHSWYLDSGCSRHMTGDKQLFSKLTMKEGGSVGFGGNQKGKIIGTGTVGNSSLSINDVWLVDGLKHNLLSISQFCDNGYVVVFNKESCTVTKQSDNSIIFKGLRKNNVYKINLSDLNDQKVMCLLTLSEEKWIWHKRLGHANWRLISKLSKLDLVRGLPKIKYHSNTLCGSCQKGKITKSSFKPKNIVSTSRPLELLHIDLFGPVNTASINGKKYGLVIVDDYSRWTWVKFLRTKDEAYDEFSIFCKQIQNEKGYTILKVRSDHGGEFENEPFENFCEKFGILHEFSSPRTPQQNGVVERKNRTLQEMARTMMHETNVAKFLWAEAVNTACYVQNRIYIRSKLNKTAYELFKGRKPDISYFHQFGCTCYILNNKVHLKKFDARGYKGIFIGYSERSKAYRLYISETHTVEESMHVKFDDKEPDQVSELVEGLSRFQVSEDQYSDIPNYSEHPFSEVPLNTIVPTDSEQPSTEASAEPDVDETSKSRRKPITADQSLVISSP